MKEEDEWGCLAEREPAGNIGVRGGNSRYRRDGVGQSRRVTETDRLNDYMERGGKGKSQGPTAAQEDRTGLERNKSRPKTELPHHKMLKGEEARALLLISTKEKSGGLQEKKNALQVQISYQVRR